MESESYYTTEGDIAYIRIRSPHGSVRSEEQEWGLRDYDEQTGELVGLEVWSASKVLPREVVDALPRLDGRGMSAARRSRAADDVWPLPTRTGPTTVRPPRSSDDPHMTRIMVMFETLPLSSVKSHLSELVDRVEDEHDRVILTRNGRAAAVLISPDDLESLEETLAVLTDRTLMEQIRQGDAAIAAGDSVSLDELRSQLAQTSAE